MSAVEYVNIVLQCLFIIRAINIVTESIFLFYCAFTLFENVFPDGLIPYTDKLKQKIDVGCNIIGHLLSDILNLRGAENK
jgi:hypothetical protein